MVRPEENRQLHASEHPSAWLGHSRDGDDPVGGWVMWTLISLLFGLGFTVFTLRLDPRLLGPAAAIFVMGCLLVCAVTALVDAHDARSTEATLRTRTAQLQGELAAPRPWGETAR